MATNERKISADLMFDSVMGEEQHLFKADDISLLLDDVNLDEMKEQVSSALGGSEKVVEDYTQQAILRVESMMPNTYGIDIKYKRNGFFTISQWTVYNDLLKSLGVLQTMWVTVQLRAHKNICRYYLGRKKRILISGLKDLTKRIETFKKSTGDLRLIAYLENTANRVASMKRLFGSVNVRKVIHVKDLVSLEQFVKSNVDIKQGGADPVSVPDDQSERFMALMDVMGAVNDSINEFKEVFEMQEQEGKSGIVSDSTYSDDVLAGRLERYLEELTRYAKFALGEPENNSSEEAQGLAVFRRNVIFREGPRVLNKYLIKHGINALILGAPVVIAACFSKFGLFGMSTFFKAVEPYMFVWSGAMVGGWVAFFARKKEIKYETLAAVNEDLISSFNRLLVVGFSALFLVLFIFGNILRVGIPEFAFSTFRNSTQVQIMLGVIGGLLELALPVKLLNIAKQFVGITDDDSKKGSGPLASVVENQTSSVAEEGAEPQTEGGAKTKQKTTTLNNKERRRIRRERRKGIRRAL